MLIRPGVGAAPLGATTSTPPAGRSLEERFLLFSNLFGETEVVAIAIMLLLNREHSLTA